MEIRSEPIPLAIPEIGEEEIEEVVACLRSGWITTGPRARRLEEDLAAFVGAPHGAAFSSCTGAMHATLLALGVGPGDEVIVPPLTWATTANVVVACGARPVFADIDPATWNLTPEGVAAALGERTRAVLPVHYAGLPADLDGMAGVLRDAGRPDVAILEDAAHALGARYKGRRIGSPRNPTRGAFFSFHPIKNMTTAEGGMLVTGDEELARRARLWRFHGVERDAFAAYSGRVPPPQSYDIVLPGFKYNLTDLQAALGIHQLRKLEGMNERRRAIAALYREGLEGLPGLTLQGEAPYDALHARHLFAVLAPPDGPAQGGRLEAGVRGRVRLSEGLRERKVGTGRHFEAVHLTTFYRERFGTREGTCPVAEDVCARVVSLPLYPGLSTDDAAYVVEAVREVLG